MMSVYRPGGYPPAGQVGQDMHIILFVVIGIRLWIIKLLCHHPSGRCCYIEQPGRLRGTGARSGDKPGINVQTRAQRLDLWWPMTTADVSCGKGRDRSR